MRRLAFGKVTKHPDAVRLLRLDFFPLVANFWRPGEEYAGTISVRPRTDTGFSYESDSSGGQSGMQEPAWPTVLSDTVVDGDITWTAGDAGANGVTAVSAPAVTINPAGDLSAGSPSVVAGKGASTAVEFTLSAGVDRKTYRVECQVTVATETLVGSVEVEVVIK